VVRDHCVAHSSDGLELFHRPAVTRAQRQQSRRPAKNHGASSASSRLQHHWQKNLLFFLSM